MGGKLKDLEMIAPANVRKELQGCGVS